MQRFLFCIILLFLVSCGKPLTPKETGSRFLKLAKEGKKEEALELVLPEDRRRLRMVEEGILKLQKISPDFGNKLSGRLDYWNSYASIDTAYLKMQLMLENRILLMYVVHHKDDNYNRQLQLVLVNREGKWYVDLPVPPNAVFQINDWIDMALEGKELPEFNLDLPDYAKIYEKRDSIAAQMKKKAVEDSLKRENEKKRLEERKNKKKIPDNLKKKK